MPTGRRAGGSLLLALLAVLLSAPARAVDPLNTMRAFCQADGRGARIDPTSWAAVSGLILWGLEPAWDHLYLIRGFELSTPQVRDGEVEVEVQYTITAEVHSNVVDQTERVETRTYRLTRGEDGIWRIRPPAPPPYLFASEVDDEALAALLGPGSSYLSDSAFVWGMLRDAGWAIPYMDTTAVATASEFTTERSAEVGDLVLYYDGDRPYHVALAESEDTVVSTTLNGGVRRTPYGAFAGEIRYRRPVASARATPTPEPKPTRAPRRKK